MPLIALDLDGTLVDQAAAARTWSAGFVERWQLPTGEVEPVAEALTARRPKGELFDRLVNQLGLPIDPDELWRDYRSRMLMLVAVADEDRAALVALRAAGWTHGIVTNGMADNQEGKIRQTSLDALVAGWVVSDSVGVRKPSPETLDALASRLPTGYQPDLIVDSVAGAARAILMSQPSTTRP